jgi:BMFP domain-containing protein YqiC
VWAEEKVANALDPLVGAYEAAAGVDVEVVVYDFGSSKDLTSELFNILKSKRDEIVFKMKIVSKDEFDVLSKRVENLENKIKKLETKKKTKRVKKS